MYKLYKVCNIRIRIFLYFFYLLFFTFFTFFITNFSLINNSYASLNIELFAGASYGKQLFEEYRDQTQFKHTGVSWGPEYGERLGFKIYYFMFGIVENKSKHEINGERSPGDNLVDGKVKYKIGLKEALWGPYFAIFIPQYYFRIISEYYIEAKGKIISIDDSQYAPFNQYDKIFGNGWSLGAGLMYRFFTATLMYRELIYDKGIFAGYSRPIPNDNYPAKYKHKTTSLLLGLFLEI